MISKDCFRTERQPSPAGDSGQTVARDEGEITKTNRDAGVTGGKTPTADELRARYDEFVGRS